MPYGPLCRIYANRQESILKLKTLMLLYKCIYKTEEDILLAAFKISKTFFDIVKVGGKSGNL